MKPAARITCSRSQHASRRSPGPRLLSQRGMVGLGAHGVVRRRRVPGSDPGSLAALPHELRLALEIAAHEDAERRAMEGELAELAAA